MTPYRTPQTATGGAVQIGLRYQRPLPSIYGDALRLQSALIDKRTAKPLNALQRLYCAVVRWL